MPPQKLPKAICDVHRRGAGVPINRRVLQPFRSLTVPAASENAARSAYAKLHVHTRTEAVLKAMRRGLPARTPALAAQV